jgi:hypothetical protein
LPVRGGEPGHGVGTGAAAAATAVGGQVRVLYGACARGVRVRAPLAYRPRLLSLHMRVFVWGVVRASPVPLLVWSPTHSLTHGQGPGTAGPAAAWALPGPRYDDAARPPPLRQPSHPTAPLPNDAAAAALFTPFMVEGGAAGVVRYPDAPLAVEVEEEEGLGRWASASDRHRRLVEEAYVRGLFLPHPSPIIEGACTNHFPVDLVPQTLLPAWSCMWVWRLCHLFADVVTPPPSLCQAMERFQRAREPPVCTLHVSIRPQCSSAGFGRTQSPFQTRPPPHLPMFVHSCRMRLPLRRGCVWFAARCQRATPSPPVDTLPAVPTVVPC